MENINFKASLSPNLKRRLIREITKEGFDKELKYLDRLANNLKKIPDGTIDIVKKDGLNYVRVTRNAESRTMATGLEGAKNLDIIEGLLSKDKQGVSRLGEIFYRLFGV